MIALALLALASAAPQVPPQPLAAPLPARQGSRTVTPDWLLSSLSRGFTRLSVRWMPDGKHLLLTLPPLVGQRVTQLALLDVKTGKRTPLGAGEAPVPSPDGKLIAHFRTEHDTIQLWVMAADGSAPRQLSHVPGGFNGFAGLTYAVSWSPDGRRVVLSHQPWVKPEDFFAGASGDTTRTSALEEDQLVREAPKSELRLVDVATGRDSLLAAFDAHVRDVSWTPDGSELVFFAQRIGYLYRQEQDESLVRAIRLKDGRLRTIAACAGLQQFLRPELSPDGRKVAIAYDADNPIFDFLLSIGVADASPSADTSAKPIVRLTREAKLQHQRWSPDGRRIYALRLYGIYRQVYAIDPRSGALTQITNEPLVIEDYAVSPDGHQLVWFGQDAHARRVLRIGRTDGTGARDLFVFEPGPDDMALSEVREIDWAVQDYPVPLRGLLVMPLGYVQGTRYPVIADIHGGGAGASGDLAGALFVNTPLEWQLWAAKGYMVFVPELRSSGAFGSKAITEGVMRDNNEIAEDVNDVVAGVDTLVARGLVDTDRTIAIGNSAGGRRANWLTVATHRFRAVVSKEGWADDFLGAGIYMTGRVNTIYGGPPVEVPERYMRNSALFHARGATTPTLFLMGSFQHGGVDPLQTVHWLYNALRSQGVEAKYVTYPDEGHGFERPANRRDALERAMTWMDDHVKPTTSTPAPASAQQ